MRRTAWLVLSPWLVVAVASGLAWLTTVVLLELWTTDGGGMGDLGGGILALIVGGLVWCTTSVVLLIVVARRTFEPPFAGRAAGGAVLAAVVGAIVIGAATGLVETGGVSLAAWLVPVWLPAAGTSAFLVTERRRTGRVLPRQEGWRRRTPVAALVALGGALVGATAGVMVDVVALGPTQGELGAAARGLVPPGYTAEEPVAINGTVLVSAVPQATPHDTAGVEAMVTEAGWRTDDVEREPQQTTLVISRGDIEGTIWMYDGGSTPRYSVTLRRADMDAGAALVGGALGACAGVAASLVRRRPEAELPTTRD